MLGADVNYCISMAGEGVARGGTCATWQSRSAVERGDWVGWGVWWHLTAIVKINSRDWAVQQCALELQSLRKGAIHIASVA